MKLMSIKEIEKLEIVAGNCTEVLPYELTHASEIEEIDFAIEQIKKYPKLWNLRKKKNGLLSIYVEYPKNHRIQTEDDNETDDNQENEQGE